MLAYFPKPYPGEILYSVLARLWVHLGQPKARSFMALVFGHRNASAVLDLPGLLDQLESRIPFHAVQADRVIDELTLFPYFTAFEPPRMREAVRNGMRTGRLNTLYTRSGLQAYAVARVGDLRYCPICVAEMHKKFGELYWLREHQIPGVLVCHRHGTSLSLSARNRVPHLYQPASSSTCPTEADPIVLPGHWDAMPHLARVAALSKRLLDDPPPARALKEWRVHYFELLRATDLSRSALMIDQKLLNINLRQFYGRALDLLPDVMEGEALRGNWLTNMVRNDRRAVHPLYHVLLQDFLEQRSQHRSPFGPGPWACGSRVCSVDHGLPIKSFTWHRLRGAQRVAVFACGCGYSYMRSFDEATGTTGKPVFLLSHSPVARQLAPV